MRILLIAPDNSDLKTISLEVAAVARYHETEKLVGTVREVDIQTAVGKDDYDAIWWATHGSGDGVLLSAGYILSVEAVGQYVAASGARLCVLNTCDSEIGANKIVAGGDADMICTISPEVGDEDAFRFGSLLAKELSVTDDFEEAFDKAKGPGATKYRYIQAKQSLRGLTLQAASQMDRMLLRVETLTQQEYKLSVDIETLSSRVTANATRLEQLLQQVLLSQQQTSQAQAASERIADLDRGRVERQLPAAPTQISLSPTFLVSVALVALVLFVVAVLLLWLIRSAGLL